MSINNDYVDIDIVDTIKSELHKILDDHYYTIISFQAYNLFESLITLKSLMNVLRRKFR